ncbi:hypothetical protein LY90DRAFT_663225 [Neocallimastix californiae]|uniref:Cryptic loci regulator 2 N-terminal domain-containing protein n=1 Tax=Neocallimastix californiae TaxID=1754190 RepID=A0A1Y2FSL7_9FUNG|nr:hypothetical protein LY90DRAFT_663225 [Neocallimastix californiae]|eukprot:ORY86577.1 hypothetical protein LY90DRAFT_663225 [Neocallimastix californiae]
MSYAINDGSNTNYPDAPWKESQKDIVEKWLINMSVKELPINYKLFSKVEKSMTKATKIITNLYGHPSGNYFETPIEAKVHINYLLGKTNICHCIYCKPSNALYMKQNKRKFEDDEDSEKLLIKDNRQSAITVDKKAEEWKWYNGYRENEIIWAPILENESSSFHSIFWTFQIVKRLSSLELTDTTIFNKLISYEKVIKYISNSIIKPSSKVNLNEILKSIKNVDLNSNSDIYNKSNILQNSIFSPNHEKNNEKGKAPVLEIDNTSQEIDEKTLDRKKKDKENLITLLNSGSEVSVGSVLNDTQNNSVQQIESLGYICRQLPLQNISIEQEEEDESDIKNANSNSPHHEKNKKSTYTYFFIPFKIIIPFLMYDPCSKNNILWNRAVMQAIDLSSSFSIPTSNEHHVSDFNSRPPTNHKTLKSHILSLSTNPKNDNNFSNTKEIKTDLQYFRFGAEQLHVGDLLRLDLSNNSTTRWIKTVNNYERVDKHEYLEVTKIVEIRQFSDILWICTGETRTVHLNEICGRYYVNCPTLERKMRISSEQAWNKDNSVFGSSKQELLILEHENRMRLKDKFSKTN